MFIKKKIRNKVYGLYLKGVSLNYIQTQTNLDMQDIDGFIVHALSFLASLFANTVPLPGARHLWGRYLPGASHQTESAEYHFFSGGKVRMAAVF